MLLLLLLLCIYQLHLSNTLFFYVFPTRDQIFAYHIKGFAGWSYEVVILGLEQKLFEYELLEQEKENGLMLNNVKDGGGESNTTGLKEWKTPVLEQNARKAWEVTPM